MIRSSGMKGIKLGSVLSLAIVLVLGGHRAEALPGDTVEAVTAWIAAHPTLQPGIGDGLTVRKSDTAAERFTFEARVLPPGQIGFPTDRSIIRSERISFYDMINGVTPNRLTESLRIIYGPAIYQDYQRAKLVYAYPSPETVDLARRQNRPLLAAQQGELLLGDRFAYWLEVTQTDSGKAYNGHITIFLREDLDKLETELRD
ncbi:MAG TPA: hypothetical protein DD379_22995 [Cyanobacteria bacterium UBA11162]|nr:hypothetical protein [Cyanobacteria bacterium UBA11162]